VRFPPGRARLGTRPVPIGSPTATMTSGTVVVIADLWWACAIGAEKCYPRGLVSLLCTNNYRPHQCRADEADNFPSPHAPPISEHAIVTVQSNARKASGCPLRVISGHSDMAYCSANVRL